MYLVILYSKLSVLLFYLHSIAIFLQDFRNTDIDVLLQTLNFYIINQQFYFVDLPGYGYAKVSKSKREAWGKFIESYLLERINLKLVLLLIDFRHPPTADDLQVYDWLTYHQVPLVIVATKTDKIPRNQRAKQMKSLRKSMQLPIDQEIVSFSSEETIGLDELWTILEMKLVV